jgi:hypothetical protein
MLGAGENVDNLEKTHAVPCACGLASRVPLLVLKRKRPAGGVFTGINLISSQALSVSMLVTTFGSCVGQGRVHDVKFQAGKPTTQPGNSTIHQYTGWCNMKTGV